MLQRVVLSASSQMTKELLSRGPTCRKMKSKWPPTNPPRILISVANPLPIPKQKWVPKKAHGKANARGLTGAEIAARELNAREREQRLQERDQLAINELHLKDISHRGIE